MSEAHTAKAPDPICLRSEGPYADLAWIMRELDRMSPMDRELLVWYADALNTYGQGMATIALFRHVFAHEAERVAHVEWPIAREQDQEGAEHDD